MLREATYKGTSLHALQSNFCISTGTRSDVSVERGLKIEAAGRDAQAEQGAHSSLAERILSSSSMKVILTL